MDRYCYLSTGMRGVCQLYGLICHIWGALCLLWEYHTVYTYIHFLRLPCCRVLSSYALQWTRVAEFGDAVSLSPLPVFFPGRAGLCSVSWLWLWL